MMRFAIIFLKKDRNWGWMTLTTAVSLNGRIVTPILVKSLRGLKKVDGFDEFLDIWVRDSMTSKSIHDRSVNLASRQEVNEYRIFDNSLRIEDPLLHSTNSLTQRHSSNTYQKLQPFPSKKLIAAYNSRESALLDPTSTRKAYDYQSNTITSPLQFLNNQKLMIWPFSSIIPYRLK